MERISAQAQVRLSLLRKREKSSCFTGLFNKWTTDAMERISAQPQVRLSLVLSILLYLPGQLPGRSSVISGELQEGRNFRIAYVYVWLEYSYDHPEGHPGQLVYTFVIRILSRLEPKFKDSLSAVTLGIYLRRSDIAAKSI
jgi:hypothetical protein